MKKLMIAAAIVCAAVASQAATITWSQYNAIYDGTGTGTVIDDDVTVYLINATFTQSQFASAYDAANGDAAATLAAIGEANIIGTGVTAYGAGWVDTTESTYSTRDVSAYYAIFLDDKAYISEAQAAFPDALDATRSTIEFGEMENADSLPIAASSYVSGDAWINVPEPTSGLLLLIGVAGLALRRRRA